MLLPYTRCVADIHLSVHPVAELDANETDMSDPPFNRVLLADIVDSVIRCRVMDTFGNWDVLHHVAHRLGVVVT